MLTRLRLRDDSRHENVRPRPLFRVSLEMLTPVARTHARSFAQGARMTK
jgi:hypothetical protein